MEKKYRLFIGNPGVGKSTMVNCLAQKVLFKNGITLGQGMTVQMDTASHDGIIYIDTPGLADIKLRKAAAEAITNSLKQNGEYQIYFVVTLESGRVRPQDLVTMKLVLNNAKDITSFNLIINKLTKRLYENLQTDNGDAMQELVMELNVGQDENLEPPRILLLLRNDNLDDRNETFEYFEELEEFVKCAPFIKIFPQNVEEIPGDESFEREVHRLESRLQELRSDKALMKDQSALTERKYQDLLKKNNELKKKNEERLLLKTNIKNVKKELQEREEKYQQRKQEETPYPQERKLSQYEEQNEILLRQEQEINDLRMILEDYERREQLFIQENKALRFGIPFVYGPWLQIKKAVRAVKSLMDTLMD